MEGCVKAMPIVSADEDFALEKNPWVDLPEKGPYVLPQDEVAFPYLCGPQFGLQCNLLPVPFMGDPRTAPVVILAINPSAGEEVLGQNALFERELLLSLTFQSKTSFYPLDRRFMDRSGYTYWFPRLRDLITECGMDAVARSIACVEWFPYQSPTFRQLPKRIPSQEYGFALVRRAIYNKALIVGPPSLRRWEEDIRTLPQAHIVKFRSPRSTY